MSGLSLRRRVQLAVGVPPVLMLLVFGVVAYEQVRVDRLGDLDASLRARAAGLAALVERDHGKWEMDVGASGVPTPELVARLDAWEVRSVPDGTVVASAGERSQWPAPEAIRLTADGTVPRELAGRASTEADARMWVATWVVKRDDTVEGAEEEDEGPELVAAPGGEPAIISIAVSQDLGALQGELRRLGTTLVQAGGVLCLLATIAGHALSRRIVDPIQVIAAVADSVTTPPAHDPLPVGTTGDELDRLSATLNRAFARLREAWVRQVRFTADASHELRTPLSVIRTVAEVALRRERSPTEYREALGHVAESAGRMQGLVEALLVLARADGTNGAAMERVDLVRIVEGSLSDDPRLRLELPAKAPLRGDSRQLEMLVRNLIENALRHTPAAGTVLVRVTPGDPIELIVVDTGEGIPRAALPHLFERFYRVDEARSRDRGGAGLGLSIVKAVVDQHGGRVDVESELGRGTTVRVRLPRGGSAGT